MKNIIILLSMILSIALSTASSQVVTTTDSIQTSNSLREQLGLGDNQVDTKWFTKQEKQIIATYTSTMLGLYLLEKYAIFEGAPESAHRKIFIVQVGFSLGAIYALNKHYKRRNAKLILE